MVELLVIKNLPGLKDLAGFAQYCYEAEECDATKAEY